MIERIICDKTKLEFQFNKETFECKVFQDGRFLYLTNFSLIMYFYVRYCVIKMIKDGDKNAWNEFVKILNKS